MLTRTVTDIQRCGEVVSACLKKDALTAKTPVQKDDEVTIKLIQRAQEGDREAFEQLVVAFERRIRAFCSMTLRNPSQGDDAAQEVFFKAYRSIRKFRGDSSFSTWLFTLAKNQCIDTIRRDRRASIVSMDELLNDDGAFTASEQMNLDLKVQAGETLHKMLNRLSVNHRFILLLKEFYGFSYEEISQVLGLSLDGVKGQLKRARVKAEEILRHLSHCEAVEKEGETI